MTNPTHYKPLPRHTLVTIKRANGLRIALVEDHQLRSDRKPGIGRVVYRLQPCTVRNGQPDTWGRMFHTIDIPAANVTPVSAEEAEALLRSRVARDWS